MSNGNIDKRHSIVQAYKSTNSKKLNRIMQTLLVAVTLSCAAVHLALGSIWHKATAIGSCWQVVKKPYHQQYSLILTQCQRYCNTKSLRVVFQLWFSACHRKEMCKLPISFRCKYPSKSFLLHGPGSAGDADEQLVMLIPAHPCRWELSLQAVTREYYNSCLFFSMHWCQPWATNTTLY